VLISVSGVGVYRAQWVYASEGCRRLVVVVGDVGGEGYNRSARIPVCSNVGIRALESALARGEKKARLKFRESVAADYGDRTLSWGDIKLLKDAGIELPKAIFEDRTSRGVLLTPETFVDLALQIARLGNPSLKAERVSEPALPELALGGYGLFGE